MPDETQQFGETCVSLQDAVRRLLTDTTITADEAWIAVHTASGYRSASEVARA